MAYVNPDQYGIDVLGEKGERSLGWEVEVKHNWKTYGFPFSTVHFSARKRKFIRPNHHFVMLNDPRNRALSVSGVDLAECSIVVKKTVYTRDEEFIEVPVELCRFWDIGGI